VSKPSADTTERLPRLMAQALERQNRRLERIETKVDRILDLVQMIGSQSDDDLDEFDESIEEELDERVDVDAITEELEKLSPEELKQQLVQLIATMKAADREDEP
jgi:hypothetical protein